MKVRQTLLAIIGMTMALTGFAARPAQEFAIGLSPDFFDAKTTECAEMLWLIYANSRVKYAESHRTNVLVEDQRVVPSFADELSARRETVNLYRKMKKEKPQITDSYWDQIDEIETAGFLDEYVWVFLKRPSWTSGQEPKRLADFGEYRKSKLQEHRAETLAGVIKQ